MQVGGSRFTSMEVSGSFHGNTWEIPLSVEVEASIVSINCSFHECMPWKLPWASIYPYIFFHLLPRVSQTSRCFYKTCIRVYRLPFVLLPWKSPWKLLPWTSVAGYLLPWKVGGRRFTFMEVSGSFHGRTWTFPLSVESRSSHCFHQLQLPWIISVEASMSSIYPYILLPTSTSITNFHLLPQDYLTLTLTLTLTWRLPPWNLAYFQLQCK